MTISNALSEKIIELLVDKILLGGIVLAAGYWVNQRYEIFKNETTEKYRQKERIADLENQKKQQILELENELIMARYNAELELIERQISEFYWPIYLRLEKDNVMWTKISYLNREGQVVLPPSASQMLEQEFILKNHQEIVEIIESKVHLANISENNEELMNELLKYIKHVAVYKTIRSIDEFKGVNPDDLNERFPEKLFPLIEHNFHQLQTRYEHLKKVKFGDLQS